MNLNLTANIKMPDHQLRRQVIDLCNKTGKPLLKLSTKDYMDNQALPQACDCLLPPPRRRCDLDGRHHPTTDATEARCACSL